MTESESRPVMDGAYSPLVAEAVRHLRTREEDCHRQRLRERLVTAALTGLIPADPLVSDREIERAVVKAIRVADMALARLAPGVPAAEFRTDEQEGERPEVDGGDDERSATDGH